MSARDAQRQGSCPAGASAIPDARLRRHGNSQDGAVVWNPCWPDGDTGPADGPFPGARGTTELHGRAALQRCSQVVRHSDIAGQYRCGRAAEPGGRAMPLKQTVGPEVTFSTDPLAEVPRVTPFAETPSCSPGKQPRAILSPSILTRVARPVTFCKAYHRLPRPSTGPSRRRSSCRVAAAPLRRTSAF